MSAAAARDSSSIASRVLLLTNCIAGQQRALFYCACLTMYGKDASTSSITKNSSNGATAEQHMHNGESIDLRMYDGSNGAQTNSSLYGKGYL